ncbi:transcription factor [Klebsormidium nitens]|uniref:Transcription factor n=1 Tax=Klebsormidium nitens TaxID=105231 RepID=A0A1Y1IFY7_KLENI|nr:transcription factor [Klebsormidium nitens]|eukprot:GAQ87676.1 transcription factor [Klebsormidium nitens]
MLTQTNNMQTQPPTGAMSDDADRQELQEYLRGLEEERRKVEAFKRELPLCMQLLTDAIQSTQAQLKADDEPMDSDDVSEPERPRDRSHHSHRPIPTIPPHPAHLPFPPPFRGSPAWLSEAISVRAAQQTGVEQRALEQRMEGLGPPRGERAPGRPLRDGGEERAGPQLFRTPGAFLPFSREQHSPHVARPSSPRAITYPLAVHLTPGGLAAGSGQDHDGSPASVLEERRSQTAPAGPSDTEGGHSGEGTAMATDGTGSTGAMSRKQRRCWSPELHRRFVNALNQLGGSQVATPKQIRELMKVDGLTNDEVKSHLQKYRLHTRRPSPIPTSGASPGPGQVVVLGSIWVPPEYNAAASSAAALYDAATAAASAPSQAGHAPSLDEARGIPPGAFHSLDEARGIPPGAFPFFQVASGLLAGRHRPSASSTEMDLGVSGSGEEGGQNQGGFLKAEVKEGSAFGAFRAFKPLGGNQAERNVEDTEPVHRERRAAAAPDDASESMREEVPKVKPPGRDLDEDESSEGEVVHRGFRNFLPPRPEASAQKPG